MKKPVTLILVSWIFLLFPSPGFGQALPEKWKKWLDEDVVYIITAKEREVSKALKSEREREAFEKGFWAQRDPTPGTPTNEFKDEHYRRLNYAREYYGRGTFKPGWQTDRGRIYIILGPPTSVQTFTETSENLVPCELWQFSGDLSLGLPPFFYLIFYQDEGLGEYKLYSPSFDGPQKLVEHTPQTSGSRYEAYKQVRSASAELAEASINYIPGTGGDPTSAVSSLSSDLLVTNIQNSPAKRVQNDWVEAFNRSKDIVTTDYSVNYVSCNYVLFVHQENQQSFIHAVMEPHKLSMSRYEQKIIAPLKLNAIVLDRLGHTIDQEEKDVSIEVSEETFGKIQGRLSAIGDIIPIVGGDFSLRLLLRNLDSKDFSSLEEKVSAPAPGKPSLSPLLFLYGEKEVPAAENTIPFLLSGHQLYPNTLRAYTANEDLILYCEIYNPTAELGAATLSVTVSQDQTALISRHENVGRHTFFLKRYPLKDVKPGYYKVRLSLADAEGKEMFASASEFSIAALAAIPRPWNFNRLYPPLSNPYFSIIRATEYLGLGQNDQVIQELEKFYTPSKPQPDFALRLASAYYNQKAFSRVIGILEPLKDAQNLDIDKLLGQAYLETADFQKATEAFTKALAVGGEIVDVLNLLGYSYLRLSDPRKATKFFERSLRINADQPFIKQLMEKIRD